MSNHTDIDKGRECCGLFGVFGIPRASSIIWQGLFSLQHRGQEGAGIVSSDGSAVHSVKRQGLVSGISFEALAAEMPGHLGIGHVRYSTTGSSRVNNVQPLVVECMDGVWAVAHNGNLVNADELRGGYQRAGAILQTSTDSEVLVHMLADPLYREHPNRVERALGRLKGAFSFLMMTKDKVMAARDPLGLKPLCMGGLNGATVFASETCALRQVGAEFIRDIAPGEIVCADSRGRTTSSFAPTSARLAQCVFELIYFARTDSSVFGQSVHDVRLHCGMQLAEEYPVAADIVIAVPDSGNSAALGFSRQSGIPLDYGFIRNHYIGRTFIMPGSRQRETGVDIKLAVLPEVIRDKRVVVVDDSIVRGNTVRRRVASLRKAGAREVHVRIACPPISFPCFYGVDFASTDELIAANYRTDDIRRFLGADSLGFLSLRGLLSRLRAPQDFCTACFSGDYPVDPSGTRKKAEWEKSMVVER